MKNTKFPDRKSYRLKDYDYASSGYYFVTINSKDFQYIFGEIYNGEMNLNKLGEIVQEEWEYTATLRENIKLHEYVIMPNHFHAIIEICYSKNKNNIPGEFKASKNTLSSIIRGFKGSVTRRNSQLYPENKESVWHGRFYDRIIRNQRELMNVKKYIKKNVKNWKKG